MPTATRAFQRRLLRWYGDDGRDLPWRRTRDPYAVLVSELMLQQTQVTRVVEAWPRFLERFPTVPALAAAPVAAVVEAWRGLGYNRRAVNLHRAARAIVERHGGAVPGNLADLEALPGVGPYTARAVATFAFGAPVGPVDTNVARVLRRAVAERPLTAAPLQSLADDLATGAARSGGEAAGAAAWSHALMDLGAAWCTARSPRCAECPVAAECRWRRAGSPPPDPAAPARRGRPAERFEGSDRYHRGRLVDALRQGAIPRADVPGAARLGADPSRADRIAAGLLRDGLAEWDDGQLRLPGASV